MEYKGYELTERNIFAPNGVKIWHDDENNITSKTKFKTWVQYHLTHNDFEDKYNLEYKKRN